MEEHLVLLCCGSHSHTLPAVVRDVAEQPLYIAVALWGLRCRMLLTTENVSRAFSLTQGRARDILHYISHEGRCHVTCERRILHTGQPGNSRCRALKIIRVDIPAQVKATKKKIRREPPTLITREVIPRSERDTLQELRRWMCQRRVGEVWSDSGPQRE